MFLLQCDFNDLTVVVLRTYVIFKYHGKNLTMLFTITLFANYNKYYNRKMCNCNQLSD